MTPLRRVKMGHMVTHLTAQVLENRLIYPGPLFILRLLGGVVLVMGWDWMVMIRSDALFKVKVRECDMQNLLKVLKVVNTEKMITYYYSWQNITARCFQISHLPVVNQVSLKFQLIFGFSAETPQSAKRHLRGKWARFHRSVTWIKTLPWWVDDLHRWQVQH